MKLILDEREQSLYDKCFTVNTLTLLHIPLSKKVLPIGDMILTTEDDQEFAIIERKSLQDLLSSIKDGRYEEQSHRLVHASGLPRHRIIYVIEGMLSTLRTPKEKKLVHSVMTSLQIFKGFSVIRTSCVQETAEWVLTMVDKIGRDLKKGKQPWTYPMFVETVDINTNTNTSTNEIVEREPVEREPVELEPVERDTVEREPPVNYCSVVKKVKKENVTPQNIGEIILCQIPSISSVSAVAIMTKFGSLSMLMKSLAEDPSCLNDIKCVSKEKERKLSKAVIKNVKEYLISSA